MVHEQGFGPPTHDNTETRALARMTTLKNRREKAIKSIVEPLCL